MKTVSAALTAASAALTPQQQFFYDHAGFSYMPGMETKEQGRARTAIHLAEAEAWFKGQTHLYFTWEPDFDDCADGDAVPASREVCILRDGNTVVDSLGSIGDADADYRRVVEAELASKVMASC